MFGFEYGDRDAKEKFPEYDISKAVDPKDIKSITPLVWQEHCVECAMPECYGKCTHYVRRSDGRCRLFKHGIQRVKNPDAVLGQNAVIEMREWAKLETMFFTSSMEYKKAVRYNRRICGLASAAQFLNNGKIRRLCYYVKEVICRNRGYNSRNINSTLLVEIINPGKEYEMLLENKSDNNIVYRVNLRIVQGYNRFMIPSEDLNFQEGRRNYISMYPAGNREQKVYFISLELVDFKENAFRKYLPESASKVKVVIWDLDNTVWNGILSEDGIDGITLKQNIADIIRDLDKKGILNSISSKNDEKEAVNALKHFGIDEYFVAAQINSNPKSFSVKEIGRILDLGIDTFVFVDDSEYELNEVYNNCRGVRAVNVDDIDEYIKTDIFDVPVTKESAKRRQSYKEISQRNESEAQFKDDIMAFLISCEMKMEIRKPLEDEYVRCNELIQRTNQLNISAERLTYDEMEELIRSLPHECYRIKVRDKYGDYGLVGFAVFETAGGEEVILKHFVFSCRASRKLLERSFFEYMAGHFAERGFKLLKVNCKKTKKNYLMQQALLESGIFEVKNDTDENMLLVADLRKINPEIKVVDISFK